MSTRAGDTTKRRRDPDRAAQAADQFARAAETVPDLPPTSRRAMALRRAAANRSRRSMGKPVRPEIKPGNCDPCNGWGVIGQATPCPSCASTGDRSLA